MKPKLYTLAKAIKKLDIDQNTLMTWIMLEKLEVVTIPDKKTGRHYPHVSETVIKGAFNARCVLCNKVFRTKYPLKAIYCSSKCRNKGVYENHKIKVKKGIVPKRSK